MSGVGCRHRSPGDDGHPVEVVGEVRTAMECDRIAMLRQLDSRS
ncbi:hypothetical protein STRTUCAR8_01756 [Streptomyces turgidiscabies Car8]|uniref:Uncharacterized protein n=1 Tax=Streptomyces turgidiscabies (strain Car8) TaxID=698760 RepID=L7F358_STRT8|nr:hypothetical protein STRTUCAR8_01756 [Streptomyces turgidiscabies Car8]